MDKSAFDREIKEFLTRRRTQSGLILDIEC